MPKRNELLARGKTGEPILQFTKIQTFYILSLCSGSFLYQGFLVTQRAQEIENLGNTEEAKLILINMMHMCNKRTNNCYIIWCS